MNDFTNRYKRNCIISIESWFCWFADIRHAAQLRANCDYDVTLAVECRLNVDLRLT